jgi:hypothetical protein
MRAQARQLTMYGQPSDLAPLGWDWVDERLAAAPLYWVVASSTGWPHPRPVWGVWHRELLCLSIGSPTLRRSVEVDDRVTVHLESGTDVVVVEGRRVQSDAVEPAVAHYDEKYDYSYDVAQYGSLLAVAPHKVMAWTAAGVAGRDGFRTGGTWSFSA